MRRKPVNSPESRPVEEWYSMTESLAVHILHSDPCDDSTPLVFLHGFMGTAQDFKPLSRRFHRHCAGIDLPGHGGSAGFNAESITHPAEGAFTVAGAVSSLAKTISTNPLSRGASSYQSIQGPVCLIGYSMGARTALAFALAHPEQVDRLVLESVSPGISDETRRRDRRATDRSRAVAIRADFEHFVRTWYAQPLFDSLNERPALLRSVCQSRMQQDVGAMARVIEGMSPGSTPDFWDQIKNLQMPVGVLAGSLDSKYVQISAEMSRRNPRIERIIIEGAGHNTHLEQPVAYLAALESLLTSDTEPE